MDRLGISWQYPLRYPEISIWYPRISQIDIQKISKRYPNVWISMDIYGYLWISMDIFMGRTPRCPRRRVTKSLGALHYHAIVPSPAWTSWTCPNPHPKSNSSLRSQAWRGGGGASARGVGGCGPCGNTYFRVKGGVGDDMWEHRAVISAVGKDVWKK
jgi:hypothetical protein